MNRFVPTAVRGSIARSRRIAGSLTLPRMRPTAPPRSPMPSPIPASVPSRNGVDGCAFARRDAWASWLRKVNSTPCQNTRIPTAPTSSPSGTRSLPRPPTNAPITDGTPITATNCQSTRRARKCSREPPTDATVLTRMFVPAAMGADIPNRSKAGRRIVPSAKPTNPPRTPTAKETTPRVANSPMPSSDKAFTKAGASHRTPAQKRLAKAGSPGRSPRPRRWRSPGRLAIRSEPDTKLPGLAGHPEADDDGPHARQPRGERRKTYSRASLASAKRRTNTHRSGCDGEE